MPAKLTPIIPSSRRRFRPPPRCFVIPRGCVLKPFFLLVDIQYAQCPCRFSNPREIRTLWPRNYETEILHTVILCSSFCCCYCCCCCMLLLFKLGGMLDFCLVLNPRSLSVFRLSSRKRHSFPVFILQVLGIYSGLSWLIP